MEKDTYKTIKKPSPEVLFKDRGSKFFGYSFPVTTEDETKEHIEALKKQHHTARHWCYAWQLGKHYEHYRANDDGEPSNSAGMPIYGQLQSFEVTNILVVIVRYFGGTKLGVGGLIQAYKTAAQMALEASKIVELTIDDLYKLQFDYPEMNTVMRIIKEEDLTIVNQKLELNCEIQMAVRKKDSEKIFELFENTYKVFIKKIED
ncbi:YigZ family protein [Aureisphaera sp. CAU 1614]|uniref:YigZ family protein n=1 Tax=Halomarinibacterium sedimenti TaxID=2857106 RepID=A0A9X1FPU5_9FLAO|nr:YigZ family protein [Halomarinibacterium sedimenti]MBW2938406.1 YigZ family protein [Halomarinibacterium sedimenti]